jgi:hypothetical protein
MGRRPPPRVGPLLGELCSATAGRHVASEAEDFEGDDVGFKSSKIEGPAPSTPEELYRDLPRRSGAVPNLWLHQGDVLREYAAKHADTADLALELPTGTGKTLPGLLVADWSRRLRRGRVAYACPTKQLARQVAATAERQGIPNVVLIGSHTGWGDDDQSRYEAAEAVALVTYSTVFNTSPKLLQPDVLLFDDAHAGEQYVAEAYSVVVHRWEDPHIYDAVLSALAPVLDGMYVQRLRDPAPAPGPHHLVRLVVPVGHPGRVEALDAALTGLTGDGMFRFAMIRAGLASCLVYLTHSQVLIRPYIPPTSDNNLFTGARQRLYLSATLGEGGELERAFGRAPIARLALPEGSPTPRSGRRFFVFPNLVPDVDPRVLAKDLVRRAGKALILAPDTATATATAQELAQHGWPVLTANDVAEGMGPFASVENATCGLASRYDGLDLPGDDCHAVLMEGTPNQDNLQERFLSERVRAGAALAERIRTRVVQGAGRATRGPDDHALVVVLGGDLTRYFLRPETVDALPPDLQAEVRFGADNSRETEQSQVTENVDNFLSQGDAWHDNAEPLLADLRRQLTRRPPAGTTVLATSAAEEIEACALARAGRWTDAARAAVEVARGLAKGGEATRGYSAFWMYLAGVWSHHAAASAGDTAGRTAARELIGRAERVAKPGTWTRELAPLADMQMESLTPADRVAVAAVAARIEAGVKTEAHKTRVQEMVEGLRERKAAAYEPQLTALGTLLGATAFKPPGSGRCDSAWCWDDELWLAMEAKSDHEPTGVVPHKDIRQANDQLRLLAEDRKCDAAPVGSATVIASPRPAVHPDGVTSAEPHVHLVDPEAVRVLAGDAAAAWGDILAGFTGRTGGALRTFVEEVMGRHGVLPQQVRERLTGQPVGAGGGD